MLLPEKFKYEKDTRTLLVLWADGSIIKYFDIDPRLAFLSSDGGRRNNEFLVFLNSHSQDNPIKSEMVQVATKPVGIPKTQPDFTAAIQKQRLPRTGMSDLDIAIWNATKNVVIFRNIPGSAIVDEDATREAKFEAEKKVRSMFAKNQK